MIIILAITFILIIIGLHELAHLLAAILVGCGVEVYSIGFGKPFYSFSYRGIRFNIAPILLGGYCKVKGELENTSDKDAFCNLSYRKKALLVSAGCLINILTGLIPYYLGLRLQYFPLYFFGFLSIWLGVTNLIPFPALDGSYLILVWLEKFMGKEKGYALMGKIVRIGFIVVMTLNVLCGLFLLYYYGGYLWVNYLSGYWTKFLIILNSVYR